MSLGSMQPHLILQVSKVGEMHVGVTESWQQEMLSLCLVSLPYPASQYRQDGRMRTENMWHCTAALPSLAQVATSRYSTAEHCLERRGQGSLSFPACEVPDCPQASSSIGAALPKYFLKQALQSRVHCFPVDGFYHSALYYHCQS